MNPENSASRGTCVICCKNKATTRDHVPPSGVFIRPKPSDLVTVPACAPCNSGASADDGRFRDYLALCVGDRSESGRVLWKQRGVQRIRKNLRFLREVIIPAKPVLVATPSGIIKGRGRMIPLDVAPIERVIQRTVRGLYFHHFQQSLPPEVPVSVKILKGVSRESAEAVSDWPGRLIGGRQFAYRFGRASENPQFSVWLLGFHEALWIRAATDEDATLRAFDELGQP